MAGSKGVWRLSAFAAEYGPIYKLQMLDGVHVVLTDPDTCARVSRKTGVSNQQRLVNTDRLSGPHLVGDPVVNLCRLLCARLALLPLEQPRPHCCGHGG